mmetsp:Transcript_13218/g.43088  ORF Transcript_13218/g.43088 Transcript_13218/m.43088 type:complete len:406 (-) Transcript_13218:72-1289(-)
MFLFLCVVVVVLVGEAGELGGQEDEDEEEFLGEGDLEIAALDGEEAVLVDGGSVVVGFFLWSFMMMSSSSTFFSMMTVVVGVGLSRGAEEELGGVVEALDEVEDEVLGAHGEAEELDGREVEVAEHAAEGRLGVVHELVLGRVAVPPPEADADLGREPEGEQRLVDEAREAGEPTEFLHRRLDDARQLPALRRLAEDVRQEAVQGQMKRRLTDEQPPPPRRGEPRRRPRCCLLWVWAQGNITTTALLGVVFVFVVFVIFEEAAGQAQDEGVDDRRAEAGDEGVVVGEADPCREEVEGPGDGDVGVEGRHPLAALVFDVGRRRRPSGLRVDALAPREGPEPRPEARRHERLGSPLDIHDALQVRHDRRIPPVLEDGVRRRRHAPPRRRVAVRRQLTPRQQPPERTG